VQKDEEIKETEIQNLMTDESIKVNNDPN